MNNKSSTSMTNEEIFFEIQQKSLQSVEFSKLRTVWEKKQKKSIQTHFLEGRKINRALIQDFTNRQIKRSINYASAKRRNTLIRILNKKSQKSVITNDSLLYNEKEIHIEPRVHKEDKQIRQYFTFQCFQNANTALQ